MRGVGAIDVDLNDQRKLDWVLRMKRLLERICHWNRLDLSKISAL
jgi:hypothetical protein